MTAPATPRVIWRADASRIAHAHHPKSPRTVCGEPVVPETLAWPALRRCLACASLTGEGAGL
jgi:hypothetical protein